METNRDQVIYLNTMDHKFSFKGALERGYDLWDPPLENIPKGEIIVFYSKLLLLLFFLIKVGGVYNMPGLQKCKYGRF